MIAVIKFSYPLFRFQEKFWILDLGFWIGGIALGLRSQFGEVGSLYQLINQIEYLKSKIPGPDRSYPVVLICAATTEY